MPQGLEDRMPMIDGNEAITIVKEDIPCNAESWSKRMISEDKTAIEQGKIKMDIREKAEKYFEPVYGEPKLTWRVEITCDYYCIDETRTEKGLIETKGYFYTIDAITGEILEADQTT